jgi:hypothetical protein
MGLAARAAAIGPEDRILLAALAVAAAWLVASESVWDRLPPF